MEVLDGMDLAARLSLEAKEYWVHLNAEGPFEKYPGEYPHNHNPHLLIA